MPVRHLFLLDMFDIFTYWNADTSFLLGGDELVMVAAVMEYITYTKQVSGLLMTNDIVILQ